jgi:signal transduction histidine kinase
MSSETQETDLAARGLIHDLNNVFTTILDAADLLSTDPAWASVAAILERSVARGRRIVGGFFAGGEPSLDLETVVESAIEFARDFLHGREVEVEFRASVEPGIRLRGSWIGWERALFNLLINAGQAGGSVVDVAGRRSAGSIEITVTDSGPGIDAAILPHIFEPGFSTRPARPGMGLHIVQSTVERNGGRLSAANRPGGTGAMFRIELPSIGSIAKD